MPAGWPSMRWVKARHKAGRYTAIPDPKRQKQKKGNRYSRCNKCSRCNMRGPNVRRTECQIRCNYVVVRPRPGQMEAQIASGHCNLGELLTKIDKTHGQRNKTCTKEYAKALGWRKGTFVWDLYEIYGFNPNIDISPDFVHLSMGLLKDFLHIKVSTLSYV